MNKEKILAVKSKIASVLGNCKKKVLGAVAGAMTVVTTAVTSFAAEGDTSFSVSDITTVLNPIKEQFTFTNIASVLAIVVGAAAVLTLGWFGVRKVISIIQRALKKGKVSV
nr:unnamed protein product [uncultured bacterium]